MKVLIAEKLDPGAVARLREARLEVVEQFGLQGDELSSALAGCQGLLVRGATKVTGDVIRSSPDVRVIARAGTGLDNIDVAAARDRGIAVLNAPAANSISVAEITLGLLLALERHLVPAAADLKQGRWEKTRYMGRELAGRTLGLLGFGRIAREVADRARAFQMDVCAHDPLLDRWPERHAWVASLPLDGLLARADVLSIHVPLTPETRGMIAARELSLMRPDAVLINCARGGIVEEGALLSALTNGGLRAAALDVFSTEPPGAHPLIALPNVIATPHLGASTREAQARAGLEAAEGVIESLAALARS